LIGFMDAKTLLTTTIAMIAFAANSILCRLALGQEAVDAASFASIRVIAGALMLGAIAFPRWRAQGRAHADWRTISTLFIYMTFFAFAYLSLSTGTGALILFGSVQLTMFAVALKGGEQFSSKSWAGFMLAIVGLVYLIWPGITAPDPFGAALMVIAGIAWGTYSLFGKDAADPLEATANNFIWSIPLVLVTSLIFIGDIHLSWRGIVIAALSGAVTSGLGYVVWFMALRGLPATRAATVQLSVPVIAALGGLVFLSEDVSLRLVLTSVATLSGITIVLVQRIVPISSKFDCADPE
jgi:drug/metabolite transporter (DMT)-like permease